MVVPQQSAFVVERLGKFHRVLSPGLHFLIPLADRVAYVHSLKEQALAIPSQAAITRDNVRAPRPTRAARAQCVEARPA